MSKTNIRVHFICAKSNHQNYINDILKNDFNIIIDSKNPQYIIVGEEFLGYDNNAIREFFSIYKNAITIFIGFESILPEFNFFDYIIARDDIKFGDRYIRLFYNENMSEKLCNGLSLDEAKKILESKKYFCNFIYSHRGHPARDLIFHKISSYKKIDSLGLHLKNSNLPIKERDGDFFTSSIAAKKPFKFSIAAENGIYKNGVTEKIYSSFLANTIPIYFGDENINFYFNKEAFVNYHDYKNIDDLLERIKEIDNSDKLYLEILQKPAITREQYDVFKKEVVLSKEMIFSIFKRDIDNSKRKPDAIYVNIHANRTKKRAIRMKHILNIEKILLTISWLIPISSMRDSFKKKFL